MSPNLMYCVECDKPFVYLGEGPALCVDCYLKEIDKQMEEKKTEK